MNANLNKNIDLNHYRSLINEVDAYLPKNHLASVSISEHMDCYFSLSQQIQIVKMEKEKFEKELFLNKRMDYEPIKATDVLVLFGKIKVRFF